MSISTQQAETRQPSPTQMATSGRPPAWFRYGVVAAATLILCSCRAAMPYQNTAEVSDKSPASVMPASFEAQSRQDFRQPVMPAIYQEDTYTPPSAIRQAQYQAGIQTGCQPGCPCGSCSVPCPAPCSPSADEYLCDGGDDHFPVAVHENWQLDGLEQEDTVAHYDTLDGRTVVTPSNKVCIYAPRFGVVRRVVDLHQYARYEMPVKAIDTMALAKIDENERVTTTLAQLEPTIHRAEAPPSLLNERQQPGELDRDLHVIEFEGSLGPYANLQIIRTGTISNKEKALVARSSLAAITWFSNQAAQITIDDRSAQAATSQRQAGVVYHQEDPTKPCLRLVKIASADTAKPGEEIEFTLRFDNIGSQVMGNVTIVDNLTNRLRYVPDSAKSSVEADFSAKPDAKGSIVLRWEIKQPIEKGQGGVLQFRCKVL